MELQLLGHYTMHRIACSIIFAVLAMASAAYAASPNQTVIPPATEIIDGAGNKWTVVSGQVYRNGVPDMASARVVKLRYAGGDIYRKVCYWSLLTATQWPAGKSGWRDMPTQPWEIALDCPNFNLNKK